MNPMKASECWDRTKTIETLLFEQYFPSRNVISSYSFSASNSPSHLVIEWPPVLTSLKENDAAIEAFGLVMKYLKEVSHYGIHLFFPEEIVF